MGLFPVATTYISRYSSEKVQVNTNVLVQTILAFLLVLLIAAVIDYKEMFLFSDVATLFVAFAVGVVSSNILLRVTITASILVMGSLLLIYVIMIFCVSFGGWVYLSLKNMIYKFMWLPAIVRLTLEVIYFFNERGKTFKRYYTCISITALFFVTISLFVSLIFSKRLI